MSKMRLFMLLFWFCKISLRRSCRSFLSIGGTTFFAKLSASDLETSRRYTSNMQINTGWIVIPDSLIKHELVVSSVVQGIDLPNLFFYIPVSSSSPTRGNCLSDILSPQVILYTQIAFLAL